MPEQAVEEVSASWWIWLGKRSETQNNNNNNNNNNNIHSPPHLTKTVDKPRNFCPFRRCLVQKLWPWCVGSPCPLCSEGVWLCLLSSGVMLWIQRGGWKVEFPGAWRSRITMMNIRKRKCKYSMPLSLFFKVSDVQYRRMTFTISQDHAHAHLRYSSTWTHDMSHKCKHACICKRFNYTQKKIDQHNIYIRTIICCAIYRYMV